MVGSQYDTVPESDGLSFVEVEVEGLAALAENLLAQGVGGKKPVAAGMPVGWIPGVRRMVDDDDADGVVAFLSVEHAPVAAGAPGAVAGLAGGGQVVAIDIGGVTGGDLCYISLVVDEFARCVGRDLQLFGDAEAEHAVFGIGKMYIGLGGERGGAVDDAFVRGGGEAVGRMFDEQGGILLIGPAGGIGEGSFVGFAGSGAHRIGADPAVLAFLVCGDRVGVVPEVEAIDILIVKPKSDMMGMVGGVAGAGPERESAGDGLTVGGIDGI